MIAAVYAALRTRPRMSDGGYLVPVQYTASLFCTLKMLEWGSHRHAHPRDAFGPRRWFSTWTWLCGCGLHGSEYATRWRARLAFVWHWTACDAWVVS